MAFWAYVLLLLSVSAALSGLTYYRGLLSLSGSVSAFLVGGVIGLAGGLSWVLLLLFFLVTSFAATRYKFNLKKRKGLQEGRRGERTWRNVVANGLVPLVVALLTLEGIPFCILDRTTGSLLFLAAVAVAAADTLASELGMLSDRVRLITTMRPVRAGTDGGVSVLGQGAALAASAYTAVVGILFLNLADGLSMGWVHIALITSVGFLGCQIDSVIGATLETWGYATKLTNNLMSISLGTAIAWLVMTWPL